MKDKTKKDIKDSLETAVIAVLCALFVISMNKKCSDITNAKSAQVKHEMRKAQNMKATANYLMLSQRTK